MAKKETSVKKKTSAKKPSAKKQVKDTAEKKKIQPDVKQDIVAVTEETPKDDVQANVAPVIETPVDEPVEEAVAAPTKEGDTDVPAQETGENTEEEIPGAHMEEGQVDSNEDFGEGVEPNEDAGPEITEPDGEAEGAQDETHQVLTELSKVPEEIETEMQDESYESAKVKEAAPKQERENKPKKKSRWDFFRYLWNGQEIDY